MDDNTTQGVHLQVGRLIHAFKQATEEWIIFLHDTEQAPSQAVSTGKLLYHTN
jgi:hypothetical protein